LWRIGRQDLSPATIALWTGPSDTSEDPQREGVLDFAQFRQLETAAPRADYANGDRPPFGRMSTFKMLTIHETPPLANQRAEFSCAPVR